MKTQPYETCGDLYCPDWRVFFGVIGRWAGKLTGVLRAVRHARQSHQPRAQKKKFVAAGGILKRGLFCGGTGSWLNPVGDGLG